MTTGMTTIIITIGIIVIILIRTITVRRTEIIQIENTITTVEIIIDLTKNITTIIAGITRIMDEQIITITTKTSQKTGKIAQFVRLQIETQEIKKITNLPALHQATMVIA